MAAYYNEIDPYAAQWLRNLIAAGHIAPGDVDERDMRDVRPDELRKYTQCHFFAGVGVWSLALRRAGWPDNRPVWTGSCPCQPFSAAGRRAGTADERHLWPHWFHLITQLRPGTIFGEQVASKDGLGWLDLIQTDLEGAGYTHGAVDMCSAGVGAPHIRQRLWFVAERLGQSDSARPQSGREGGEAARQGHSVESGSGTNWVANTECPQRERGRTGEEIPPSRSEQRTERLCDAEWVANTTTNRWDEQYQNIEGSRKRSTPEELEQRSGGSGIQPSTTEQPGPTNGFWRAADWLFCRDGKWRPVESGTFPLAHGVANRVGRLRAYGNAINAEAAQEFIGAYLDGKK